MAVASSEINISWAQFLRTCDGLIRGGQGSQAAEMVNTIRKNQIPRSYAQPFAHLLYRLGKNADGLELLAPFVYPENSLLQPASEKEIATYAIMLIKIGSNIEGRQLLSKLSSRIPETDLYRAFADQAVWDYDSAAPQLKKYIKRDDISDYERGTAQVNLCAALIGTSQTDEARTLLSSLQQKAREECWTLLFKNLQELEGQLAVVQGDYDEAKRILNTAANRERYRDDGLFDFFIDKWNCFVDVKRFPTGADSILKLKEIRARAEGFKHWESVRECDRRLAQATHDRDLFLRVYFGTPFPAYRRTLLKEATDWVGSVTDFILGSDRGVVFDLTMGASTDERLRLKPGQSLHRGLFTLASDLYRPLFLGHVFSHIFPDERFIAGSSNDRVSAVLSRLRKWLEKNQIPIEIQAKDLFYQMHLKWDADFGLRFQADSSEKAVTGAMASNLARLHAELTKPAFTSVDVADQLKISKSSANRILRWGLEQGKLKRIGNNRNTKYGFCA